MLSRNPVRHWFRRKHVCVGVSRLINSDNFTLIWCTHPRCDYTVYMSHEMSRKACAEGMPRAHELIARHRG